MSTVQFYVSVAVMPAVSVIAVLIGILWNNANMNARFGDFRSELNARLGELSARMGELHNMVNAQFTDLRSELHSRFAEIDSRFAEMNGRFGRNEPANRRDQRPD